MWLGVGMCLALFPMLEYMFLIGKGDKGVGGGSNYFEKSALHQEICLLIT